MSSFQSRPSILLPPNLSTIPSSALVTSSTSSSSFILRPSRSGSPAVFSDAAAHTANQYADTSDIFASDPLRSISSMRGLLLVESTNSMLELGPPSACRVGQRVDQGLLTPGGTSAPTALDPAFDLGRQVWREETHDKSSPRGSPRSSRFTHRAKRKSVDITAHGVGLFTSDTLLQISAPPHKSTSELRVLLGNSAFRLKRNACVVLPSLSHRDVSTAPIGTDRRYIATLPLEKAKPRARVELDIVLESETCVQGNPLKGHITIHVLKNTSRLQNTPILLSKAKVRVVGYEAIPYGDMRCTFYQCTALLSHVAPAWDSVLATPPNQDGWAEAKEGIHVLPFSLTLPADGTCGTAKGTLNIHSGVELRYFAMASLRLKDPETSEESIAHFYRSCQVWPRLSFTSKLSPAPRPLVSEGARTVFMGGSGKVRLSAAMHRLYWVAGQRCVIHIRVVNESKKTVKGASITLLRTTTVFKPLLGRKGVTDADPDACKTSTMRKVVAASVLMMGEKCSKGHASAKGWWAGVRSSETADFVHHIILPSDALSVTRVRLLEVEYTLNINVTTGGPSSNVEVTLPIRIVNFLSIDPPPTSVASDVHGRLRAKPQFGARSETWYRKSRGNDGVEETVPGMKYSGTDMTVVAQNSEMGTSMTQGSISSQADIFARDGSGDTLSNYPGSESMGTQRLNISMSLNEIDRVIGTDPGVHNFVTEVGQLTCSGSLGSRLSLRGPRGPRLASLPEAIITPDLQEESTPSKHARSNTLPYRARDQEEASKETVRPFIGRRPSMTRASSMSAGRSGTSEDLQGEMKSRSRSELLPVTGLSRW